MTITLHADPVPLRVDDTGTIRVGKSRVTLDVLLQYWRLGMKPEEIVRGLDTLSLADVLGALAYYHRHQNELDAYLRQREQEADTRRQQIETANAERLGRLKALLDASRAEGNGDHAASGGWSTTRKIQVSS
jgi:uncharacterized protein (DUF433 family)